MKIKLDLRGRTKPVYYWNQLPIELQKEWYAILRDEFDLHEVVGGVISRIKRPKTISEWEVWVYKQKVRHKKSMKYKIINKKYPIKKAVKELHELSDKAIGYYLDDTESVKYCELRNLIGVIDFCECGTHKQE